MPDPVEFADVVRQVIRNRKTKKVLAPVGSPVIYDTATLEHYDEIVESCLADSGWAPFHYDRNLDGIAEPWRVYQLSVASCRRLAGELPQLIPDMKPGNKMPSLLSGCGCLTLFTWVPVTDVADGKKLDRVNREHLSATAAAVQNFLLMLTAHQLANYWSSGTLIEQYLFSSLGIPAEHKLAAAVYVHYPNAVGQFEVVGGKQRARRSRDLAWLKHVDY